MRPTFASFTVAKGALDAARANLYVTGQNLSNQYTTGYTRQAAVQASVGPMNMNMRYANLNDIYIGEGVKVNGITQLRDPYLDTRYRLERVSAQEAETKYAGLTELEYVFDEITTDGIDVALSDLMSQIQNLIDNRDDSVSETIVQNSAQILINLFNYTASQISSVYDSQMTQLETGAVADVNQILTSISYLNDQIQTSHIAGAPALELMDERNLLLDELSGYMDISVTTTLVEVGKNIYVEQVSVSLKNDEGDNFLLVDHDKANQIELTVDEDSKVGITLLDSDGDPVGGSIRGLASLDGGDITDILQAGELSAYINLINAGGEFDDPPSTERGIPYYENMLNTIVAEFAYTLNTINSDYANLDTDPPEFDKPLFEASDGGEITAANIQIATKWADTAGSYITGYKTNDDGDTVDNLLVLLDAFNTEFTFTSETGTPAFTGTIQGGISNISVTLGLEMKEAAVKYTTYSTVLLDVDTQRMSVSSVNTDEESINLVQYQQAYQAASRFMTTLDEAVDTIINSMGLVGR